MWSSRPDLVNMGLKLGLFVLDPKNNFEWTYLQLHGGPASVKGKELRRHVETLRQTLSDAVSKILRNGKHRSGKFVNKCLDLFKTQSDVLNDLSLSVVWASQSEHLHDKGGLISADLKTPNSIRDSVGNFHLQDKPRLITFED
jgi:hypothetical protein